jgi:uncharacterized protein
MIKMSRLSTVVKRHPLTAFFVLAYALSWWPWILYAYDLAPSPIAGFGPFLAALVVLAITSGKTGVLGLLRRMVQWRVGLGWYAAALLIPVAINLAAAESNILLGAQALDSERGAWTSIFSTFFFLLLVPGVGGAWEEPGWRGYAVPKLQSGRSALVASLIFWPALVLWHLPLMIVGAMPWSEIVFLLGFVIVFNWVFNNARGSVLIIMVMHAMNNTISFNVLGAMFTGADSVRYAWLYAVGWCVVAMVVTLVSGPQHLSRKYKKQEIHDGSLRPDRSAPEPVRTDQ